MLKLLDEVIRMDYVLLGQKIRAARMSAGLSQEQLVLFVTLPTPNYR